MITQNAIPIISGMNIYEECYDEPQGAMRQTPSTAFILAEALRQKYRITVCECGGSRIHSKTTGRSKCFQCLVCETATTPLASQTRQRCQRCKKFRWAVLKANYCKPCYERVQKAKAHPS